MKSRIITVLLFILLITGAQAQAVKKDSVPALTKERIYRVEAGYSQVLRYGNYVSNTPFHAINLGGTVEFPLKYKLGLVTGLKYSYLFGNKVQLYPHTGEADYSYTGHSIDIPVRISYTLPIFWGLKLFGFAGSNFNIGLAQTSDIVSNTPYVAGGKFDIYKTNLNRFSIMLGAGGGIQWKDYRLKGGYDWGLNSISKDKNSPERLKGWYAAFEYEF